MNKFFLTGPDYHVLPPPQRFSTIRGLVRKLINIALAGLLTFSVVGSAACAIHIVFGR